MFLVGFLLRLAYACQLFILVSWMYIGCYFVYYLGVDCATVGLVVGWGVIVVDCLVRLWVGGHLLMG